MASGVDVKQTSRLRFYELVTVDDYVFWNLPELPDIPVNDDDKFHRVTGVDRIDLLAYEHYGDAVLWWVIAVANDLELVPTDLHEGDVLRIPSKTYVQQQLFKGAVF